MLHLIASLFLYNFLKGKQSMSIKHVKKYYHQQSNQYMQMLNTVKELQKMANNGEYSNEQLTSIQQLITKLKENMDRISYIVYLLQLPNRSKKEKKFREANKELEEAMSDFNDVSVEEENSNILKELKEKYLNKENTK